MASVGTVTFDIAAESAKLRSELDKVKRELGGMKGAVASVNDTLKTAGKLAAGYFSFGAITGFISRVNSAADSLNDLSGKLNASAANLATIQLAAQQSGGSVEGVTVALSAMSSKLGEAINGSKSAAAAFQQLGLNTQKLAQMRSDEAFQRIAAALSGVENSYQRASLAQDIFGKGAKDLSGLFSDSAGAIDGARASLEAHGAALTDLDIARIGVMNDELGAQQTIIQNLSTKFLANFAPAVSVAVDAVSELTTAAGGANNAGRILGITFVAAVKAVQAAVLGLASIFEGVRAAVAYTFGLVSKYIEYQLSSSAWIAEKLGLDIAGNLRSAADAVSGINESMSDISRQAMANATAAAAGAVKAAGDAVNAANLFDEAAARMDARAAAASATMQGAVNPALGGAPGAAASGATGGGMGEPNASVLGSADINEQMKQASITAQQELANIQFEGMNMRLSLWDQERLGVLSLLEQGSTDFMTVQEITQQGFVASLGNILMHTGAHNKKMAKIQQGIALAQAVWSTARGVANALGSVPFPGNIAAAAVVAAQGLMQIMAIKKQKYSEGGTSASYGGAGGGGGGSFNEGSSNLPDKMPANEQQQARGQAQIVINGNIFSSRETTQYLIDEISKAVTERDVVLIGKNSRQAQELVG